jgi:hypothetical protein
VLGRVAGSPRQTLETARSAVAGAPGHLSVRRRTGCPGGRIRAAAGDAYKQSLGWSVGLGHHYCTCTCTAVPPTVSLYLKPFHLGKTCRVDRLSAQGEIHRAGWVLPSSNHVHKPIFLKKKAFIEQRVQVQQPIRLTGS